MVLNPYENSDSNTGLAIYEAVVPINLCKIAKCWFVVSMVGFAALPCDHLGLVDIIYECMLV
jgi:hypothetical protein